jgi:CheY-like chemotaxis protein
VGANTSRQLGEYGHRVTPLAVDPESAAELQTRRFACAAINLSVPSAWTTLRSMRTSTSMPRIPLIAYALAANAPRGFWLGPVDFSILPINKCNLAEDLNRLVPKVRRVIAMSNDIDVMSDVRTQLTDTKISTAVVLDGRQALDLVATVRPEAAVLHLSPSCVDVFRAITGLRSSEIARDIPILFLLDDEPQPREEAFLTAGIRMLSSRGNLQHDDLIGTLSAALNPYCGPGAGVEAGGIVAGEAAARLG